MNWDAPVCPRDNRHTAGNQDQAKCKGTRTGETVNDWSRIKALKKRSPVGVPGIARDAYDGRRLGRDRLAELDPTVSRIPLLP